ncbi:transcription elongation factor GreA [Candidatus Falkowbacteria bacterium CG10_big_fil_rev_8_21_14_0_10_39_11]|uniref:Transcription elongation factor GreA n=1 Tax=Candidatus Falkowbacteria bacterium CG10_big_fil_rev_8_21_14_0_10_39_11 TaxID=1974565 RepID=A0A2H0V4I3_9BACT|nr:MAG: transcription elongation factor GreA [Candidatus Falkowbacteria bacterium CG10_big_fil_rev_8_21_14_0_10_39_11]
MNSKILTPEGLEKIKAELKDLKEVRLPDITDKIEKAKEMGDLSENAEYHDAKDQQGLANARVVEIENILKTAIVQEATVGAQIGIGSSFSVEDDKGNKKDFTIVGYNEADPLAGRISNESPMGGAFLGKEAGDVVAVKIPKGTVTFKIIEVK